MSWLFLARALPVAMLCSLAAQAQAAGRLPLEHDELEAAVEVPYRAAADGSRRLRISLLHPGAQATAVAWQLDIVAADGALLKRWRGDARAGDRSQTLDISWNGRDEAGSLPPDGVYTARFAALPGDADALQRGLAALQASGAPANPTATPQWQEWDLRIGEPAQALRWPPFTALARARDQPSPMPAGSSPGYTIYYGNLHSQTNHSDGGGDLSTCNNAETPQDGAYGPDIAFGYARDHGLDFLMASEHNHMYDGSNGTASGATPDFANGLYSTGLAMAAAFNLQHADFLALYGMEWGVTTNGGHLNIIGADGLYEWEYNGAGQLIGTFYTPKSDYAALYTFMRGQQVLGQFNHPATSGQFAISGTSLAYTADGDAVMVLSEVLNTSAFSVATDESETSRTSFEGAWRRLLEAGFHLAPASNQDNHCANWGASYGNRTGVLIPSGTALDAASLREALLARRVFATMDKTAQALLRSGDYLMGARLANSGPLALRVDYASSSGHAASQVQIYEGVPGRNGTVTLAASSPTPTLNPAPGEHFYYAKITQDDGRLLWSAPLWVTQLAAADAIFRSDFH
jgi:hypothetical protein